jgi:hypothetical protein
VTADLGLRRRLVPTIPSRPYKRLNSARAGAGQQPSVVMLGSELIAADDRVRSCPSSLVQHHGLTALTPHSIEQRAPHRPAGTEMRNVRQTLRTAVLSVTLMAPTLVFGASAPISAPAKGSQADSSSPAPAVAAHVTHSNLLSGGSSIALLRPGIKNEAALSESTLPAILSSEEVTSRLLSVIRISSAALEAGQPFASKWPFLHLGISGELAFQMTALIRSIG